MTSAFPAWRRKTIGETRLPVIVAIVVAILCQAFLPDRLGVRPRWLLPSLEGAVLLGLTVYNPIRFVRSHPLARTGGLLLVALMTFANAVSAILLIRSILDGKAGNDATTLLGSGAAIYITNIVAFGLWYWEFDRGGPFARAEGIDPHPDFLFPQMATPELMHDDWEPYFVDYLYVSFTNATAFSPTDTLPLSRWAKAMMALQSAIALSALALVIARAVNILHGG